MLDIKSFFFPDENTKFLVTVCYVIIAYTAFSRFNKLAKSALPTTSLFAEPTLNADFYFRSLIE